MTYYLGKAGALVALPDPEVGLPMTPERIGGTHQLLSGNRVRDTIGRMRTWQLSWTAIDLTTYGTLESFYLGAVGPGPYYFLNPEQRNRLTVNVSSGTSALFTTAGFTRVASSALFSTQNSSSAWNPSPGPFPAGSFWTLGVMVPNGYTTFANLVETSDPVPVVPLVSYAASVYLVPDGSMPGSVYLQIDWRNAAGTTVSSSSGNSIAPGVAGRSVAVAAAPSTAATAVLSLHHGANNTTGSDWPVYADGFQFEQASSASTWVPGSGVPLVTVDALSPSTPLAGICDAQMTLLQVA